MATRMQTILNECLHTQIYSYTHSNITNIFYLNRRSTIRTTERYENKQTRDHLTLQLRTKWTSGRLYRQNVLKQQ